MLRANPFSKDDDPDEGHESDEGLGETPAAPATVFNPVDPHLSTIQVSLAERIGIARSVLVEEFVPKLCEHGEDGEARLLEVCLQYCLDKLSAA